MNGMAQTYTVSPAMELSKSIAIVARVITTRETARKAGSIDAATSGAQPASAAPDVEVTMVIKEIQLHLTLPEFEALERKLQGVCVEPELVSIYEKLHTLRDRLNRAAKLHDKFPIREA